nr:glycosyltransferase family 39 protein [Candidatus Woesearchaeota archaeon]
MDKELKKLLLIFIVLILIKSFLSYLVPSPSIFGDEYAHSKMARSFFNEKEFSIHGFPSDKEPPLYPMFLSLAYVFKDMTLVYIFMKVINAILSSLIIFPAYFLAKDFLIKKNALLAAILISVLPSSLAFSPILMAENLYYPLILASIFFIYKSFTSKNYSYDIFAGLFIGLSLLTKFISIFIFLPIFIVFIYKLFKKEYHEIKKKIIMVLILLMTIMPWQLRNFLMFGFSFTTITGSPNLIKLTSAYIKIIDFLTWNFLYLGFIVLGTGIIFFMLIFLLNKEKLKENKYKIFYLLSFFSILSIILIASNLSLDVFMFKTLFPWLTDRPVGRYVDVILPLIILSGFISYEFNPKKFKKIAIFTSILLLFASQLILFPLFPINNLSLTFIGVSKYLLEFILFQKTSLDTIFSLTSLTIFSLL